MWPERLSFGEQVKSRWNLFMRIHGLFLYYVAWACKLAVEAKKVPIFFQKKSSFPSKMGLLVTHFPFQEQTRYYITLSRGQQCGIVKATQPMRKEETLSLMFNWWPGMRLQQRTSAFPP